MFGLVDRWKRSQLAQKPFPSEWLPYLENNVPFFASMEGSLREKFLTQLKIFVWEKNFEGAHDFEVTDEMRVVIAASAVRLTLYLDLSYYDNVESIVIYEDHFKTPDNDDATVYGVAHSYGSIILSWAAVLHGLSNPYDGKDTAAHEFAHALDLTTGTFNGTPELRRWGHFRNWGAVMSHHFLRLKEREKPERKVMDMYGATNEAEFFAVATESFFEKSKQMKKHMPELYEELKQFYGWDPESLE